MNSTIIIIMLILIIVVVPVMYNKYVVASASVAVATLAPIVPFTPPTVTPSDGTPIFVSPSTKYLLTEQVILMTFPPSNPPVEGVQSTVDQLLRSQQNPDILSQIGLSNLTIGSLPCYALYTNTFKGVLDPSEYDILGAYFILQLKGYVGSSLLSTCSYYSPIKKVILPPPVQSQIINLFQSNPAITFSGTMMDLDDFIPRISKFLYLNYRTTFYIDYLTLKNTACT
jgi:hypothetical protein